MRYIATWCFSIIHFHLAFLIVSFSVSLLAFCVFSCCCSCGCVVFRNNVLFPPVTLDSTRDSKSDVMNSGKLNCDSVELIGDLGRVGKLGTVSSISWFKKFQTPLITLVV